MSSPQTRFEGSLHTLDRFAGAAASDLAVHSPVVGPGWTNLTPAHGTLLLDGTGGVYPAGAAVNQYALYGAGVMPTADYWVQASILPQTPINRAWVIARAFSAAGESNGYGFGVSCVATPPNPRLVRITADNVATLVQTTYSADFGVVTLITIQVVGTTIRGFLNGNLVAEAVDVNFAGPGQAGLALNLATVQAPTTGPLAGQFQAWY